MGKASNLLFDEIPEMIFTDRVEPRDLFWSKRDTLGRGEFYVINYYGFGGIGKSRLCKFLCDTIREGVHPVSGTGLQSKALIFSFEELDESYRKVSILEKLCNKMENECSFVFPLFKYALYVYYRTKGSSCDSPEIKRIQDNVIASTVLDALSFVPVVGSIGNFVLKTVDSASASVRELVYKNSKTIQKLDKMSEEEIADELVKIFALELRNCTMKETEPLIIFLDTYERLQNRIYETSSAKISDEWLWGKVGLIRNIPNVLWVVAGQRKLDWGMQDSFWNDEENMTTKEISEIAEADEIKDMLIRIGITEPEILEVILRNAQGVPVHLSLCKDTYFRIKNEGDIPCMEDFDMGYSELAERFIGGLNGEQRDIVELLACMEKWTDQDIIRLKLSADAYGQVLKLSFINQNKDYMFMHRRVQEIVYQKCSELNKKKYYNYACELIADEGCTLERSN